MAYKKYIKRGGKVYGPYIYHSRKIKGRVISEYRGKFKDESKKAKKFLIFFIILMIIFSLLIVLNYTQFNLTKKGEISNFIFNFINSVSNSINPTGFAITGDSGPFIISERTEYGLTQNIVYIEITENLGKDQIINISNDFFRSGLTEQISYKEILLNQSHLVDDYGLVNTSLGKYSYFNETNETITDFDTNETINQTKRNYYDSKDVLLCKSLIINSTEFLLTCDYILADKSVLKEELKVVGNHTEYDYLPIPNLKEKTVIGGQKIEQKQEGIPLPKNSKVQLKMAYQHPLAVPENKPNNLENKYNVTVISNDGTDTTILDPSWWNFSWDKRMKITFDNSDQGENLTNFPVLIKLNNSRINYANTQNSGEDIRFLDDDGSTEPPYEIELWNESGESFVWVNVPQIDGSSTTDFIYMYYNNSAASDGQNVTGTWINDYGGVWHMNELDGQSVNDSTSNNNDGIEQISSPGTQNASGKIAGADYLDGSDDYINLTDIFDFPDPADFTLATWLKPGTINTSDQRTFISKWGGIGNRNYRFEIETDKTVTLLGLGILKGTTVLDNDTWYHVAVTISQSGDEARLYVNGVEEDSNLSMTDALSDNTAPLNFGQRSDGSQIFNGTMDEVRFSNTNRSADWINASYKSQNDVFNTYGAEEPLPSIDSVLLNATSAQNTTDDNLTAYPQNPQNYNTLIYNWKLNGTSIAVLNMPFDTNDSTTAKDYSGLGNDGTPINETTWTNSGISGGAYVFDGDGDYINISNENNFDFERTDNFSIFAWIKAEPMTDGQQETIFAKGVLAAGNVYRGYDLILTNGTGDHAQVMAHLVNDWGGEDRIQVKGSTTNLDDGNWHFVGYTYNGTSNASGVSMYVDGNSETETILFNTLSLTILNDINPRVGTRGDGNEPFNGTIDEVIVYNRTLTPEQIAAIYNSGTPRYNLTVSQETNPGENWSVEVTPNNETQGDGETKESNNITIQAGPDTTPPTFSNAAHNNVLAGVSTLFSVLWNDGTALHPNGQYIFSTNNTGTWVNDSAVNFTTTPEWANVTKILNSTEGVVIGYRWYATDNVGNLNATDIFTLTTTLAEVEQYRWYDFEINATGIGGNLFDAEANVTWTHENTATSLNGSVFYNGSGDTFIFRFGAELQGEWTGNTTSNISGLNGLNFLVNVTEPSNGSRTGWSGQIEDEPTAWARQSGPNATLTKRTPILVMWDQPGIYYNDLQKMRDNISEFLDEHGFNGVHFGVNAGWFNVTLLNESDVPPSATEPDIQTFVVLEELLKEVVDRGGWVHIWMWGQNYSNTTAKNLDNGWQGAEHVRLLKYIRNRLGPVPGWSMGVGFDIDEWLNQSEFEFWLDNLAPLTGGYHHWIGGRYSEPPPDPTNEGNYTSGGITWNTVHNGTYQYAGWEQQRQNVTDEEIENGTSQVPDRPMFSEDRFRRRDLGYPKDFANDSEIFEELSRFAIRGVAAIYGRYINQTNQDILGDVWPNKADILTEIQNIESLPTYSNVSHNSTIAGQSTLFSIFWNDSIALHPNGQYIFSTNNTGTWVNDSAVNFTTTPEWANVTKTLNSTEGVVIGYRWYSTDNVGNLNATDIFTLTTTPEVTPPTITIDSPTNTTFPTGDIDYNITVNEALSVAFASVDGGSNMTMTNDSQTHYFNLSGDHPTLGDGFHNITFWVNDTSGNANESTGYFTVDTTNPTVTLNTPVDNANFSSSITFNGTASDNINLTNVTLYGNWTGSWIANETNSSGINNSDYIFTKTISDGTYIWNYYACDNVGNCDFNSTNRTFTVDTTPPTIMVQSPINNTSYSTSTIWFNATADEPIDTWIVN
jgi:hypothetical protein